MMSEAMARHIMEAVLHGGVDVAFRVGRLQITIRHIDGELHLYQQFGGFSLKIADIDIVDGYLRIEAEDGVLIGLPFEEESE